MASQEKVRDSRPAIATGLAVRKDCRWLMMQIRGLCLPHSVETPFRRLTHPQRAPFRSAGLC